MMLTFRANIAFGQNDQTSDGYHTVLKFFARSFSADKYKTLQEIPTEN